MDDLSIRLRDEYRRLSQAILNVDRSWSESLDLICQGILTVLQAQRVSLWRLENNTFELVSSRGEEAFSSLISSGAEEYLRHLTASTVNASGSWSGMAFMDVLVMDRERPFGFLRVEAAEREWRPEEELFLMSLSDLSRQALRRECESELRCQLMNELGNADVGRRSREEFLTLLARQLGDPLDAIVVYAELGRDAADLATSRALVANCGEAATAGRHLLTLLIEYAKAESGQIFHDITSCAILPLIDDAHQQHSQRAITLRHSLDPQQEVIADPYRLLQALSLLLEAAGAEGPALEIELRLYGGTLLLWLRDPVGRIGLLHDDSACLQLILATSLLRLMGVESTTAALPEGGTVCEIQLNTGLSCELSLRSTHF